MTGDGVNDVLALKRADIGITVALLTLFYLSRARSASRRAIFQRMKNYTIYAVSITIGIVLGFMLIALIWKFEFMVLIIVVLNDGTIITISKDKVKPSPVPDSWKFQEIFPTSVALGTYLALMSVLFCYLAAETDFFTFGLSRYEILQYVLFERILFERL